MKKELIIKFLENAVRQQELCNRIVLATDAVLNDHQTNIDVYLEAVTGLKEGDYDEDTREEMANIFFDHVDKEDLPYFDRAEAIYYRLLKYKQPEPKKILKNEQAITVLENTIKQQLMCHKIGRLSDNYPNHFANSTESTLFALFGITITDDNPEYIFYDDSFETLTFDESKTIRERAEKMYDAFIERVSRPKLKVNC